MHVKNVIGTEQNATLHANWRYRRNWRYKLYRTDLQEVSGPIRIKLTRLVSRQIVIFRENFLPPSKMPSRTPMARMFQIYPASHSYFMSIDKPTVALKCFSGNSLSELCLRLFKTFAIVYGRGGTGSGLPEWTPAGFCVFLSDAESKIFEKPDPDAESLFYFGSSRSLRGHFLGKNMGKLRLDRCL